MLLSTTRLRVSTAQYNTAKANHPYNLQKIAWWIYLSGEHQGYGETTYGEVMRADGDCLELVEEGVQHLIKDGLIDVVNEEETAEILAEINKAAREISHKPVHATAT